MEASLRASSTLTDVNELCNTLHPSDVDRSIEVLMKRMKDQMNGDVALIGKAMKTSLIKGRKKWGDSNKCYDWHDERMRVGSQMHKAFHMPGLLREWMFEKNYSRLNKAREMHHQKKTEHSCT